MDMDNVERLPASEVRDNFADTLSRVAFGNERLILVRNGKAIAALISIEDLQVFKQLEDRADVAAVERTLATKGKLKEYEQIRRARKSGH
jgi:prevent-host-death family protein